MRAIEDYIKKHDLYLMSELPNPKQLKSHYINTYIFIKKKPIFLYYIDQKGKNFALIVDQKQFKKIDISNFTDESKSLQLEAKKENLNKLFDIILSNKTHIAIKIGGLRGYIQQKIQDALTDEKNSYYTSMNIIFAKSGDNKANIEIKKAFDDKNHPLHLFLKLDFAFHELKEVAFNFDEMSLADLLQEYGETAVKWGAMQYFQNAYQEKAKKYGETGKEIRHSEDSLIKKEIIRLYQLDEKLEELSATHIVIKIKKSLIDFMEANGFKKKAYSDRFIAKQIREFRNLNKTKKYLLGREKVI